MGNFEPGETLPSLGVCNHHREVDGEVGDVGERMTGVEGQRCQCGEYLGTEPSAQAFLLGNLEIPVGNDSNTFGGEFGADVLVPTL